MVLRPRIESHSRTIVSVNQLADAEAPQTLKQFLSQNIGSDS